MTVHHPLRLLVADDDQVVREGYAQLLSGVSGIEVVATAADGAEAVTILSERIVDVALLDVEMPRMDGVAAAREICRRYGSVAVVMFTAYDDPTRIRQAMTHGARGFLTKDMSLDLIARGLEQAAQGITVLGPGPAAALFHNHNEYVGGQEEARHFVSAIEMMSGRKRDVLRELAQGLSNREIAERLLIQESTVRSYLTEILAATGCRSRTALAVRLVRTGWAP